MLEPYRGRVYDPCCGSSGMFGGDRALQNPVVRRVSLMASTTSRKSSRKKSARPRTAGAKSSRDKVRAHRERLRKQGLRPIQIWVPDTRSEEFAREAHRPSRLAANSPAAAADQAFVDSVSIWNDLPDEDFGLPDDEPTDRE
jgi:hypothetical protein